MKTLLESQVYWRLIALAQAVPEVGQSVLFDWVSGALSPYLIAHHATSVAWQDTSF